MSDEKKPEEKSPAAAPLPKRPAKKKPSALDETKARNKQALAAALAKAQAVQIPPPAPPPPVSPVVEKTDQAEKIKARKVKLVRHSISMPDSEYAQIAVLKKRIADFGGKARRSELMRAGIAALAAMNNVELTAIMAGIERIRPGRPKK